MPLIEQSLASQIGNMIPTMMKTVSPMAEPMPFQKTLGNAVAAGIQKIMTSKAQATGIPLGPMVGPGSSILGFVPPAAAALAVAYYSSKVGSVGVALMPMMLGVFIPVSLYLLSATVMSISGMGGTFTPASISGWGKDDLAKEIINAFPTEEKKQLEESDTGKILIEAIASGFTMHLQLTGIPGPIPAAGIPAGPLIAKFS